MDYFEPTAEDYIENDDAAEANPPILEKDDEYITFDFGIDDWLEAEYDDRYLLDLED